MPGGNQSQRVQLLRCSDSQLVACAVRKLSGAQWVVPLPKQALVRKIGRTAQWVQDPPVNPLQAFGRRNLPSNKFCRATSRK
jgi:hypothetical protein